MEDKIRNLLWAFVPGPLNVLLIFGGWFSCIMAPVCNSVVLAIVGLGIIIFVFFLVILLGVLKAILFLGFALSYIIILHHQNIYIMAQLEKRIII